MSAGERGGMPDVSAPASPFARLPVDPLRAGSLLALAGLAVAVLAALVAVIGESSGGSAVADGVGLAVTILLGSGTVACALACLGRHRLELVAILGIVAAVGAVDLVAVGLWRDIASVSYGKTLAAFVVWSLALLLVLSLVLAAPLSGPLTRILRAASSAGIVVAAVLTTRLVFSAGEGSFGGIAPFGFDAGSAELRVLGVALVIGTAAWLGTITASRLERAAAPASL